MVALSNNEGPLGIKALSLSFDGTGNFVFGAMGTAAGYSALELQSAAGAYHIDKSGFGSLQSFGNTPENYSRIQAGINVQIQGGKISVISLQW